MLGFNRIKRLVRTTTARLALSYLGIIMAMSIGFSVVFFFTSAHELGRPPHPLSGQSQDADDPADITSNPQLRYYIEQRANEGRHVLLLRLIALNVFALIAGGILSYFLARRTLEPIERNMEAQAQFVSDASHELRTPLTALQATNEVALRKPRLDKAQTRDLLQHNIAEVAKLEDLIDGLLRLARPDKHLLRTPVSLQVVASEAMNALLAAAQAKKISIEDTVPDMHILGDQAALTQALSVLIDNAVKYSPEHSAITLSGGRGGKYGTISVIDRGKGIAAKDLPHIFDRFYRADQSRGKHTVTGYGIGLSLAKKLVHQMDGEIIATSTENKGSTFTIRLPLA